MDELDLVLEQYKEAKTEQVEEKTSLEEGQPVVNPASETTTTQGNDNPAPSSSEWFGNPAYYQSGQKIGQLKPLGRKKVKPNAPIDSSDAVLSGAVIDGALFLMLIDLMVPFLIMVLNNRFSETKVKDTDLQLTEAQKKKLEPLADRVVQMMSMRANPAVLLTLAMTGIYGLNFMAAKMDKE